MKPFALSIPHMNCALTCRTLLALTLVAWVGCANLSSRPPAAMANPPESFADLPEAVTSFGGVASGGWLYVCGGHRGERHDYSSDEVSGSFHRLNLTTGTTWEKLPSTEPAQGAPLVAHGRYVYRLGGMAAQNRKGEKQNLKSKSLVTRFDTVTGSWNDLKSLPVPRSSHDAAVVGNRLFVGGGWQLNGGTNRPTWHDSLLALDLTRSSARWQSISQPFKRRALAMAALDDQLFFIGGMDSENAPSTQVDVYNTRTGQWSKGPELPSGTMKGFGCSAIVQNSRLYYSGMQGDLYQLSSANESWQRVGKLAHPRFFHRLAPVGTNRLIAAGGEDSEGKRRDLELLTPVLTSAVAPLARPSSNTPISFQTR
jgi:Kelch motif